MRFYGLQGQRSSTAGIWLVPHTGLMVRRQRDRWQLGVTTLLDDRHLYPGDPRAWYRQRRSWLERQGLDRAQFPRRRDAVQALEYALAREPLPEPEQQCA